MTGDEALPEPPTRPRWVRWLVAAVVVALGVGLVIRLATTRSTPSASASLSRSASPTSAVPPVLPDFPASSPRAPRTTYVGIQPAIPGRPVRRVSADGELPTAGLARCALDGGCRSVPDLPQPVVAAVRVRLPGAVLQYYSTVVARVHGRSTLVHRSLIATIRTVAVVVNVDVSDRPRTLHRTSADGYSRIVQRAVGPADSSLQLRVEVRGQVQAGPTVTELDRLAADPRFLVLS